MSKLVVMAVYDKKAEIFHRPMFDVSRGSVVRSFAGEINSKKPESMLAKYPGDFDLYLFGTWDDGTGLFDVGQPQLVITGVSCVEQK